MSQIYVLSHQGGWDEILMVVAPIFVIWCLLAVANTRAKQRNKTHDEKPH